jgi:hypothetical protein
LADRLPGENKSSDCSLISVNPVAMISNEALKSHAKTPIPEGGNHPGVNFHPVIGAILGIANTQAREPR